MSEPPPGEDDATLMRRVADEDQAALRTLLERYAPKVTGYLRKQFKNQLKHPEIDEAVNIAAQRVWRYAPTFGPEQGTFRSWFLTIAHRAALKILKDEEEQPDGGLDFDPRDVTSDCDDEPESQSRDEWLAEQLGHIIEKELTGFEQIVARTDMAAGGSDGWVRLANEHNKTKNTVQATRSKVWKKIRGLLAEREAVRATTKGRK
ncbi:MAG TPA: sigma factor [Gemmataceae bacterium]|jgi:RNA polymerase sigma factor (sigma-70 family)|nr:sigma factor [Gemmataceae bacterium]